MAPEVFLNLPYNEKADVFSLGVVIFELFLGVQLADMVLEERTWGEAKHFAKGVAQGRRTKTDGLPPAIAPLVDACWQQVWPLLLISLHVE
jgi:serine/threonine protein kinase